MEAKTAMEEEGLRAITDAAEAMHLPVDAATVIEEIVAQAPRLLREFAHVSLTLVGPTQTVQTLAAATELAAELDALQNQTGEGPCLDLMLEEAVVVKHAPHEQRWPSYTRLAVERGLRSQITVRLQGQQKRLIGLSLCSTSGEEFDPGSVGVAEHFAVHAGLALGQVRREEELRTAIGTRTIIGTAVGVVMERYRLNQEEAFAYLMRQSSTQNQKLRLVAKDLVEHTERTTSEKRWPESREH